MEAREIAFGVPNEQNDYCPFAEDFIVSPEMLFHGTSEDCARAIQVNGFAPTRELKSSSFARSSAVALKFAVDRRNAAERGAIVVVTFPNLRATGIRVEPGVVHLDDHRLQPTIVGVCYVPHSYKHV